MCRSTILINSKALYGTISTDILFAEDYLPPLLLSQMVDSRLDSMPVIHTVLL